MYLMTAVLPIPRIRDLGKITLVRGDSPAATSARWVATAAPRYITRSGP